MADQCIMVAEQGALADAQTIGIGVPVAELGRVADTMWSARRAVVAEHASGADTAIYHITSLVHEAGTVTDHTQPTAHLAGITAESGRLRDAFKGNQHVIVTESGHLLDAVALSRRALLVERVAAADGALPRRHAFARVSEHGLIADSAKHATPLVVAETMRGADAMMSRRHVTLVDSATPADDVRIGGRRRGTLAERGTLANALAQRLHARGLVAESACAEAEAVLPSEGIAWTTNTDTWGASRYTGFNHNSLAVIGGQFYGAGPGGLYALDATADDNGSAVLSSILTGQHQADADTVRRGGYVYLQAASSKPLALTVRAVMNGAPVAYTYPFEARPSSDIAPQRAKVGRGLRSVLWQYEVTNPQGNSFAVNGPLAWVTDAGSRRV